VCNDRKVVVGSRRSDKVRMNLDSVDSTNSIHFEVVNCY
jgi:hypothetical protein